MITPPVKTLFVDIETMPHLVATFIIGKQRIPIDQVVKEGYIAAWGASWADKEHVVYRDVSNKRDYSNNKTILQELRDLLDQADVVIGHNSKSFDIPKIMAEFAIWGIKPPSPFIQRDTLALSKKVGKFHSHKLAYLTKKFKVKHVKSDHKKYPGLALWLECMAGNSEAWQEMKKYNIIDVKGDKELYPLLLPYIGLPKELTAAETVRLMRLRKMA